MLAEAELGERITGALILRRVAAIEHGNGRVLVGVDDNAKLLALQNFLRSNFVLKRSDVDDDEFSSSLMRSLPNRLMPQGNIRY